MVHGGEGGEHAAEFGSRQAAVPAENGVSEIPHDGDELPAVAAGGDDGVGDARAEVIEHAALPQVVLSADGVGDQSHGHVDSGVDGLDDDGFAVQTGPFEDRAGPAVVTVHWHAVAEPGREVGDGRHGCGHGRTIGAVVSWAAMAVASQRPVQ